MMVLDAQGPAAFLHNLAQTNEAGAFAVTAPGSESWQVWVQQEGFTGQAFPVTYPEPLRVVLSCTRLVRVLPLGGDGNPRSFARPVFLWPGEVRPRRPEAQEGGGVLVVRLAPSTWQLVAEEERVFVPFSVPAPCEGVLVTVPLAPAGGGGPR
ncbi:MAG: hypothetical protein RMI39_02595 [Thermoanaerobaculum sp.]|nr:hypothetical protein [Thermoanaerobaculum sp.]